jgi:hypothetical protein
MEDASSAQRIGMLQPDPHSPKDAVNVDIPRNVSQRGEHGHAGLGVKRLGNKVLLEGDDAGR